jgi:ubiquinone/menaquinone biosynthesis C-methylase UbiE
MSLRGRFFALAYDRISMRSEEAGLRDRRRTLLEEAKGDVLEIGAGTGLNVPHYPATVTSLTLTEPERPLLARIEARARRHGRQALVLRAPAEDLPFEDASFDTAVTTLVLCGVDDQPRALRELRRVLRPGGTLLFLEHVRSGDAAEARLQDRVNGFNRFVAGCDCNRRTLATIEAAGFEVERVEREAIPKAPRFVRPLIVGRATSPRATPGS